jgi:hypothetical protein
MNPDHRVAGPGSRARERLRTIFVTLLLIPGIGMVLVWLAGRSTASHSQTRSPGVSSAARDSEHRDPGSGRTNGFLPRADLEPSGYSAILGLIERWSDSASLREVAALWEKPGLRLMSRVEQNIDAARAARDMPSVVRMTGMKATLFNSEGDVRRSYEILQGLRSQVEGDERLAHDFLYPIIYYQGIA